jgi:uncharacterized membrane protein YgcG
MILRRKFSPSLVTAPNFSSSSSALVSFSSKRFAGMDLSMRAPRLRTKDQTSLNLNETQIAVTHNNEIMETLAQSQTYEEIQYRKRDRPWEIVPQYRRRRVTDLVGIMKPEHRMEVEQLIEKIAIICDIETYLVIVPTVGYVKPRVFAQSIFFDWGIGEPKGNGLLIVLSQGDGNVQSIASPVLERYFSKQFLDVIVQDVLAPCIRETRDASYGLVQMMHAAAQYIDAMRPDWERRHQIIPMPIENKIRFAEKTFWYGVFNTSAFWVSIFCSAVTIWMINRILDLYCPECGSLMHHVTDEENLKKFMTKGQYLEHFHKCAWYRVHKCPKQDCPGKRVRVYARDLYQDHHCLPCEECNYNTVTLEKTILKLPTREEDGIKQFLYTCENCRVARDIRLPLLRPLDDKPQEDWFNKLMQRAESPVGEKKHMKVV